MKKKLVLLTLMLGLGSCGVARAQAQKWWQISPPKGYHVDKNHGFLVDENGMPAPLSVYSSGGSPSDNSTQSGASILGNSTEGVRSDVSLSLLSISSPQTVPQFLSVIMGKYDGNIASSRSAAQATQSATQSQVELSLFTALQNEVIIKQNAQIISLLERIANK